MNTPSAQFNEIINNDSPSQLALGVAGVIGLTQFGPVNRADLLVDSWPSFKRYYGGEMLDNEFPTICRRALERGSSLRVCSIRHSDAAKATPKNLQKFVLSAPLVAGQQIRFDVLGGTEDSVSQTFVTDALTTLNTLVQRMKAIWPSIDYFVDAKVIDNVTIYVSPGQLGDQAAITTSGTSAPTVTKSYFALGDDANSAARFTVTAKYAGDYNDLIVKILPPSNGLTGTNFDLNVSSKSKGLSEDYKNLSIQANTNQANQTWAKKIKDLSLLIDLSYVDLTSINGPIVPLQGTFLLTGGSPGGALTDADYLGSQAEHIGIYNLTGYDDIFRISTLVQPSIAVAQAMDALASNSGEFANIIHLDNQYNDANQLVAQKNTYGIDSSYTFWWAGGLRISDTLQPDLQNATRDISELGDVLGCAAVSDKQYGPWYSFSGMNRGKILNSLGIVNDFSSSLQILASAGINTIISTGSIRHLWHSFTGSSTGNPLSFINVRMMLIELKKALKPKIVPMIEEPNDIPTWKKLYLDVKPTLDERATRRAITADWSWQGDQFASSFDNLVVNVKADVRLGKYKVILIITEITSLQQITVDITLSPNGVSITDNLSSILNSNQA